eukprot:TRINITY_DN4037_c0_g1_i2.p1 TRINITY_DN4037_c0_g1~~TRINITY_DN4037_c0_g1_i2.p1  ORF type:complete len:274 (-),score=60.13 TRINITY_DN4037_c0_g1_i2:175-996(-)
MKKLADYFENHNQTKTDFPTLDSSEKIEIQQFLDVPDHVLRTSSTRDLINETLSKVKKFEKDLQSMPNGLISNLNLDSEDEEGSDGRTVGTIRIKLGDEEAYGTVRIKDDEDFGTVKFCGTVKINESGKYLDEDSAPSWASNAFGTMKITRKELESGDVKLEKRDKKKEKEPDFLEFLKVPEAWELNILALENGEWTSNMNKDVFGKYKKERPTLAGLFGGGSSKTDDDTKKKSSKEKKKATTPSTKRKNQSNIKKSKSSFDRTEWIDRNNKS